MTRNLFQPAMIAIIAILFMVKSFVPLGFMPTVAGSDNISAITICSGVNEVQIFVDENGQKVPAPVQHSQPSVCEFSLASVFTHFDMPQPVITPVVISHPLSYAHEVPTSLLLAQNFNARGPPTLHI